MYNAVFVHIIDGFEHLPNKTWSISFCITALGDDPIEQFSTGNATKKKVSEKICLFYKAANVVQVHNQINMLLVFESFQQLNNVRMPQSKNEKMSNQPFTSVYKRYTAFWQLFYAN